MIQELNQLKIAIFLIAGIIILLVVAALVGNEFLNLKGTQDSYRITNETITFTKAGINGSDVVNPSLRYDFRGVDNSTQVLTNLSNITIMSNNYNFFVNGSLIPKAGMGNAESYNITYTYSITASSFYYNTSTYGQNTYQNIARQSPLLGTVLILLVIASVALGIFAFFDGKKRRF